MMHAAPTNAIGLPFQIALHAATADNAPRQQTVWQGQPATVLMVPRTATAAPFDVSFETVLERLSRLPRLYIEPDGSFVWVAESGEAAWQLDGLLADRNERLLFLELKGTCTVASWQALLATVGWPTQPVMVQSLRDAVFFSESEFARLVFAT